MKQLFICIVLLIGIESYACRCDEPGTIKEAYRNTKTIVHGKVLKRSLVTLKSTMNKKSAEVLEEELKVDKQLLVRFNMKLIIKIELELIQQFKGKIKSDTITIFTGRTSASCGITWFEEGKEYLIYTCSSDYAYWAFNQKELKSKLKKTNTFWTNHCTRTIEYNYKEANELERLAKNKN